MLQLADIERMIGTGANDAFGAASFPRSAEATRGEGKLQDVPDVQTEEPVGVKQQTFQKQANYRFKHSEH